MAQEERQLLLQDLCSRLPYELIGEYSWKGNKPYNRELTGNLYDELKSSWCSTEDSKFLPYLRSMSSMTEEEQKELEKIIDGILGYKAKNYFHSEDDYKWNTLYEAIDWLNSHHFDYRGLIEKGLAWVAPEGMYNKH